MKSGKIFGIILLAIAIEFFIVGANYCNLWTFWNPRAFSLSTSAYPAFTISSICLGFSFVCFMLGNIMGNTVQSTKLINKFLQEE